MACIINASTSNGLVNSADGSGIVKLQSNGVATNALAWVNFNGTGTVAIRSSYNVSSITDNGSGDYTVNFTTAMADVNYCALISGRRDSETGDPNFGSVFYSNATYLTTSLRVAVGSSNDGTKRDCPTINVAIFGN